SPISETGIEEAGIMDVELAHRRIVGDHFRRMVGRNADLLLRGKQVELVGFQNETTSSRLANELPEIGHLIMTDLAQPNGSRILLSFVRDDVRALAAFEIHRH